MEVGRVDPGRLLVFVDERGTHTTSLAPLYAYAPVGERAFLQDPEEPRQEHHAAYEPSH